MHRPSLSNSSLLNTLQRTMCCLCAGAVTGTGEPTVSLNGSPARAPFPTHSRARSCTSHIPSSTSGPVQTQQPCSLKGSLSSDDIYAGLRGDVGGAHGQPGPGEHAADWRTVTLCSHLNIKHCFMCYLLVFHFSDTVSSFLFFICYFLQAGQITLRRLREWPINRVASQELDFSVGLCLCLSVCISSLLA